MWMRSTVHRVERVKFGWVPLFLHIPLVTPALGRARRNSTSGPPQDTQYPIFQIGRAEEGGRKMLPTLNREPLNLLTSHNVSHFMCVKNTLFLGSNLTPFGLNGFSTPSEWGTHTTEDSSRKEAFLAISAHLTAAGIPTFLLKNLYFTYLCMCVHVHVHMHACMCVCERKVYVEYVCHTMWRSEENFVEMDCQAFLAKAFTLSQL